MKRSLISPDDMDGRTFTNLLEGGKTTPTKLFNAMEEITRQVLHGHRALQPTLNELQRIRTVLGIP
jgi:hypothetical protein